MRRVLVVVGLVLIGLGLALYFALSRTQVDRALRQGQPVHLLWAVGLRPSDPPDLAVLVSLLPRGEITFLLVPGTLSVPSPAGWITLSAVYASGGLEGWKERLSALVGFPFLQAREVRPADWDQLVEVAGGVVVRPETRLFHSDPERGLSLDFPPGEQLVSGSAARDFLVYSLRYAEDPRFSLLLSFFQNLLPRLWAKHNLVRAAVSREGGWEAQAFWRRALALPEEKMRVEVLPAVVEDSLLMPDLVQVRKLRERIVSGQTFLTRDEVRVVVLNGTRERFLATRTGNWLSARGFTVKGVGSADRTDYTQTFLIVGPGAEEKAGLLRPLLPGDLAVVTAQAFGVEKLGGWPVNADVVLLVGADLDLGT